MTLKYIFNRKNKLNKDGQAQLQLRITHDRVPLYFSTGIYLTPGQWNKKSQSVRNHSRQIKINVELSELKQKALNYYSDHREKFNSKKLLAYLRGNDSKNGEVLLFFDEVYNRLDLKPNTLKQHLLLFKYIRIYNKDLSFQDIDYNFKSDFENWLTKQPSERGGKLSKNYIALLLRLLKKYTNEAIRSKLLLNNPFLGQKIVTEKSKKSFLTGNELAKIESLDVSNRRGGIPESKDMFLFSCYTGIRFSDLIRLTKNNFYKDGKGLRMEKVLKKTEKSQLKINLPLYLLFDGKPETLIKSYIEKEDVFDEVFGPFSENHLTAYNDHIRLFAELTNINKRLSSHSARHTCAMIMLNEQGYGFDTVQSVLGHASIATTQRHYAKMLTRGLDDRLERGL